MARASIERVHAEWLSLVETSGPFLTVPTLKRALPNGLEAAPDALPRLRLAHAEWRADPSLRQRFIRWVLDEVLELGVAEATDADPSHRVGEHRVTLRPDLVVHDRAGGRPVLLVHIAPAGAPLDRPLPGVDWAASPIDRAALLARASEVPLALVTDGDRWTLVWAPGNASTGTCTWRAELWLEEPVTQRAFLTLLGARRFFNLPADEGLGALLAESADRQQEVTDRLGTQVRHAVELLVATLDRQDRERHGELLMHLADEEVYKGAVTVMMRLVFLFVAEERRLLPIDDPIYAETLAASTIRAQLQEQADRDTEDRLERSTAAWHRVLALFRAVHGGIEHDALRLPAYGGGLFDPDRYPFLEGRAVGTDWHTTAADPLPVDDRTLLHLLDALQTLDQGGRDGARVRLSFRSLDVEQIGHVYEGLLDHTAVRLTETALGLVGKLEPELPLADVEDWAAEGADVVDERLAKETGRTAKAIRKLLETEPDEETRRAAAGRLRQRRRPVRPDRPVPRPPAPRPPRRPDGPARGIAVRDPGARPPVVGHLLHAAVAGRGGRPARPRPDRLLAGPSRGARPGPVAAAPAGRAARPEDRRHRDGLGRIPRRRLPLPGRPPARGVGQARRRRRVDGLRPPPRTTRRTSRRSRPSRRPASSSPTAWWPSAACTGSTRTRWPSRWRSCRCG